MLQNCPLPRSHLTYSASMMSVHQKNFSARLNRGAIIETIASNFSKFIFCFLKPSKTYAHSIFCLMICETEILFCLASVRIFACRSFLCPVPIALVTGQLHRWDSFRCTHYATCACIGRIQICCFFA